MSQTKDFDVDQITVFIDGERVADLDAIGWDSSTDSELDRTVGDDGNVWVLAHEEPEATIAVKATSRSIPRLEQAYQEQETINLAMKYADAEPREESVFQDGKLLSFGPSDDYEEATMPMYEGETEFDRVDHDYGDNAP